MFGVWVLGRVTCHSQPVPVSLKYAVTERERRYLVARLSSGVATTREIVDRYVLHTRLRLREVRERDATVVRKLGHKVRLPDGPAEVACTNFYLSEEERAVLTELPASVFRKKRHLYQRDGFLVAIDDHEDGTPVTEIDDGDHPSQNVPDWLDVLEDVSDKERWTGSHLAG